MNTMRRPLGHGPNRPDDEQEVRAVRGRTAAERAAEEMLQQPVPRAEPGFVAIRRSLGAGPRT
ncbi:hypothetical protein ACWGE1_13595 [Streptomyces sp. NPDC054932]